MPKSKWLLDLRDFFDEKHLKIESNNKTMENNVQTVRDLMQKMLPKSFLSIAQKTSSEEIFMLSEDIQELNQRLVAQQTGNEAMAADLATKTSELTALNEKIELVELQKKNAEALNEEWQTKFEGLLTEKETMATTHAQAIEALKPYQEYADRLKQAGKQLPIEDAGTGGNDYLAGLPEGHPDKIRAENMKKKQEKAKK